MQWEMSGLGLHIHTNPAELRNGTPQGECVRLCVRLLVCVHEEMGLKGNDRALSAGKTTPRLTK